MTAALSQTRATAKAAPLILLLIIFIDGLGTALLLPMLPMLLDPGDPAGVVFGSVPNADQTALLYGVLLAGYAFAMMVGAPLLGALSDRIGRRPTLVLAVAGSVAGYALSTWAVSLGSVGLLIVGRLLGGTFAGSVPVAQAMLVQTPESAMKRIGWVMFAMTAGFFAGPALTGVLLASHTLGASLLLPLQVALTLSVACLLMAFLLPSTPTPAATTGPSLIRQILNGFTSPATRRPLLALLWLQIGWNLFYQYLPWMLAFESQPVGKISLMLAVVGIGMCIAFIWVAGALQTRYPAPRIARAAIPTLAVSCALIAATLDNSLALVFGALAAIAYGVAYTALIGHALACEQSSLRGTVLGIAASLAAGAAAVTALLGGVIGGLGNLLLASLSVGALVLSWVILVSGRD
ncbi:MFS transporter [Pseudomonas sp. HR96]|uniref:MFS transporter n=1 Tax=Pseudomonas sp. HR96 TaxID=1027966 RepID=UPI002A762D72|nr:MFS transporter [Pseudomonas sp. HR96]WPO99409.1 MFS transporter [Pseudomonas sp. HR96]